jgi:hypothetical protein
MGQTRGHFALAAIAAWGFAVGTFGSLPHREAKKKPSNESGSNPNGEINVARDDPKAIEGKREAHGAESSAIRA